MLMTYDTDNPISTDLSNPQVETPQLLQFVTNVSSIWRALRKHQKEPTIQLYLRVLQLDADKLSQFEYFESFATSIISYPKIYDNLCQHINDSTKKSLDYLLQFSSQQIDYIINLNRENTKLLACPGSGKTRSIIGRVKFMVESQLAFNEEVFVVTFSKFASLDFVHRVKQLFPDHESFISLKNISTIDSLAKSILSKVKCHKSDNVELLSIAFRNFLKSSEPWDLKMMYKLNKMKYIFVDEAQDLNSTQNDILTLLRDKVGVSINLIGDPNQNIYQFRGSSDKYLMNSPGKEYQLTINFRSTQNIITFFQGLRPVETGMITCNNAHLLNSKVKVIIDTYSVIHRYIIKRIKEYPGDISNIAIICPTRGIKGNFDTGLSVIFNLLKKHDIKFNQLYDESGIKLDRSKKEIVRIPDELNLLTYHGTKGLEFDLVIVMDFFQHLFCIQPSEEEHNHNRYLIYVAASRAKRDMIVCCYSNKVINQWITLVDAECYKCNTNISLPKLTYRSINDRKVTYSITDVIDNLSEEQLDKIHDMIHIKALDSDKAEEITTRVFPDHVTMDRGKDEIFFGILGERVFFLQNRLSHKSKPMKIIFIEKLLSAKFVVINDDKEYDVLKKFIASRNLTWEKYDSIKNELDKYTSFLIGKYFNRDMEFEDIIICKMEFIKVVENNKAQLQKSYARYMDPMSYGYDYREIMEDHYYLVVVEYAYHINHYYYIENFGAEKKFLLKNAEPLFECMNKYAHSYKPEEIDAKVLVEYTHLHIFGEIDFVHIKNKERMICEIKCVKDVNIKHHIQILLYNLCYRYLMPNAKDDIYLNKYRIINLLRGVEHNFTMSVSKSNMFNILNIVADIANTKFESMVLVYDLETSHEIRRSQLRSKPVNIPANVECFQKGNSYCIAQYPEITEIAIKDFETDMVIINTLVCCKKPIPAFITKITGINNAMLKGKPSHDKVAQLLVSKFRNMSLYKFLAHNGNSFDHKIMTFYKLIDVKLARCMDTKTIIPLHMPLGVKLDSKAQVSIFKVLFPNESYDAHRAMNDVDALIRILKFLGVDP
jgi:DNA polymerase III epsilon subunit-like protein